MSQENVEIVRKALDAWNANDFEAASEPLDPAVVIDRSRSIGPTARVYRGIEEGEEFWNEWKSAWENPRSEATEYIDVGDRVIVLGRFSGRGAASGVDVKANLTQLYTLRDGKIVLIELFQSRTDALEAAGLRE
jgi:ketosteroid isomerase-like protein